MALSASEARHRFLKQAAYQLAPSAPAVSAALSSCYIESVISAGQDLPLAKKEWDTLRREACGACGNILLPGWTSFAFHSSRPTTRTVRQSKSPTPWEKKVVSICLRCDRKSVQALHSRPPKHVSSKPTRFNAEAANPSNPNKPTEICQDTITKSANATSKQRKKSRKGGLQAMLEKNKSQNSGQGGLGLDLMDFMR